MDAKDEQIINLAFTVRALSKAAEILIDAMDDDEDARYAALGLYTTKVLGIPARADELVAQQKAKEIQK